MNDIYRLECYKNHSGMLTTVDLGGTFLRIGNVDLQSRETSDIRTIRSPASLDEFVEVLRQEDSDMQTIRGVAVAVAGGVIGHAEVARAPALTWATGVNFKRQIEAELGTTCWVMNDVFAAAKGELYLREFEGVNKGLLVTVSTGIGAAEVRVADSDVEQFELGHANHPDAGARECQCGQRGCFQAAFSGFAVEETLRNMLDGCAMHCSPMDYLITRAERLEPWALKLFKDVGRGIGKGLASCLKERPGIERIVLMGGFALSCMPYIEGEIKQSLKWELRNHDYEFLELRQSKRSNISTHVGCAESFLEIETKAEEQLNSSGPTHGSTRHR